MIMRRWVLTFAAMFVIAVACAPTPEADSGGPEGVRVQQFTNPINERSTCIVVTHDTAQGASAALWCTAL